jgi:hypothetical protein
MDAADKNLRTLRERAKYLASRIAAKESVGWETVYDARERAALLWAIEQLSNCANRANRATAQ